MGCRVQGAGFTVQGFLDRPRIGLFRSRTGGISATADSLGLGAYGG